MIIGQAAGAAAALAAQGAQPVQDIEVARLQRELLKTGAVLELAGESAFGP